MRAKRVPKRSWDRVWNGPARLRHVPLVLLVFLGVLALALLPTLLVIASLSLPPAVGIPVQATVAAAALAYLVWHGRRMRSKRPVAEGRFARMATALLASALALAAAASALGRHAASPFGLEPKLGAGIGLLVGLGLAVAFVADRTPPGKPLSEAAREAGFGAPARRLATKVEGDWGGCRVAVSRRDEGTHAFRVGPAQRRRALLVLMAKDAPEELLPSLDPVPLAGPLEAVLDAWGDAALAVRVQEDRVARALAAARPDDVALFADGILYSTYEARMDGAALRRHLDAVAALAKLVDLPPAKLKAGAALPRAR